MAINDNTMNNFPSMNFFNFNMVPQKPRSFAESMAMFMQFTQMFNKAMGNPFVLSYKKKVKGVVGESEIVIRANKKNYMNSVVNPGDEHNDEHNDENTSVCITNTRTRCTQIKKTIKKEVHLVDDDRQLTKIYPKLHKHIKLKPHIAKYRDDIIYLDGVGDVTLVKKQADSNIDLNLIQIQQKSLSGFFIPKHRDGSSCEYVDLIKCPLHKYYNRNIQAWPYQNKITEIKNNNESLLQVNIS